MEFEALYKKYYKEIYHYGAKLLDSSHLIDSKELSEDYSSEAWVLAYQRWDTFESEYNVKAFVYICVKNRCFNHLQYVTRLNKSHKEILFLSKESELPDYLAINSDVIAFIFSELQKLPPQCQKITELFFKGVSSNEIAAILHITRKTALNQKLKAIGILKQKIILKFGYI